MNNVNGSTLGESVENLTRTFKAIANDRKLQKSLNNFVTDNASSQIEEKQIVEVIQETSNVEVHTDEVIVYHEETVNEKG